MRAVLVCESAWVPVFDSVEVIAQHDLHDVGSVPMTVVVVVVVVVVAVVVVAVRQ